ncbi:hypothetical protein C1H46_028908 [Malus baccata]|uniref:F-box domain-containing protein n=1 Tax=Malus baccata TaxID=106549 RepID=A0A540LGV7_MALBA|nr:hypothetical protein C1H46_028908 [Malus baccata]
MSSMLKHKEIVKDTISTLQDADLHHHTLSFLPTLCAVQTTIVSRRWKNLWTSVHSLVFDEDAYHEDFPRYVDNVLFFRDSSDIRNFRLSCGSVEDISRIDGWIRASIWFNVAELNLSVASDPVFELPESLFLCKTLKKLTQLTSNFIFNTPIAGCSQASNPSIL